MTQKAKTGAEVSPGRPELPVYWKTVLDTLQEALLIISPEGRILTVNQATERITGYKAEELLGRACTIFECTGCDLFGRGPGEEWCSLFQLGKVTAKRCLIATKGGGRLPVLKRASVLTDSSGQVIGAVETLTDISQVTRQEEELLSLRRSLASDEGFHGILGQSLVMQRLFQLIENAAHSEAPVLINGETGVGKELVAHAVHKLSRRSRGPFVNVNCAALNDNLLESELFGHVKGAFTGADSDRVGRFEAAHGGTIFLDEIGDVPPATQVKLLKVLESGSLERVGDHRPIKVDVRIITATNRDLSQLMERSAFRQDLYFRINVIPLGVPALRQRPDDIPLLAQAFLDRLRAKTGRPLEGFEPAALALLCRHPWPGNVRELKNVLEYAFVVCRQGLIEPRHLPERLAVAPAPAESGVVSEDALRQELLRVLRQTGGNQSQAAKLLGVSRMTVYNRLKRLGVDLDREL